MELLQHLGLGFEVAFSPVNILYCFVGALLGTLVGVLPGLGPMATIAMLLPITFTLPPVTALVMLAGIYYGAQYGGSITAILINLPGESSTVITALDGYKMAQDGRAGAALAIAAIGSFCAGTFATGLIAIFAPPLAELAIRFGPADYFALMVLGLVASIVLASGSLLKAVGMVLLGLLLGLVGSELNTGAQRFTFGFYELSSGLSILAVAMGLFALGEIVRNLEAESSGSTRSHAIGSLWLKREDIRRSAAPVARGSLLGSVLGILPGGGATLASFASYSLEKKVSRNGAKFGTGAIEGVAAPESANNAAAQTAFIPMLTLGIPSNPVMALMIGALIMQGIQPGPSVIREQPSLFWGLIVSMWLGNVMLLILNLPLVGLWTRLLHVPYRMLFPVIMVITCIGVYSIANSEFDVRVMTVFGVLGVILAKLDCEPAPLILGFILGPMMEEYFQRALILSDGDFSIFVTEPISATLLVIAAIGFVSVIFPALRRSREDIFVE